MGDPRRIKKKYDKPRHPWNADRIKAEKEITTKYGLANKRELWRAETMLRNFRRQARRLLARSTEQKMIEEKQLLDRLRNLNMLKQSATLDDVLALNLEDLLERRLQTLVFKEGSCNTVKQARQFVVHGHISIDGKKATAPSYLVKAGEESTIQFINKSLADSISPAKKAKAAVDVKEAR